MFIGKLLIANTHANNLTRTDIIYRNTLFTHTHAHIHIYIYIQLKDMHSDVDKVRDTHTVLPGPSGRTLCACQCGTTWAEVPARSQGFVCHARSWTQHTTHLRAQGSRTHLQLPSINPSPAISPLCIYPILSSLLFLGVGVYVCMIVSECVCVGWLAMPSVPSAATPPTHLPPFPLITRVGLTICVPVCSHSEKRGMWSGGRRRRGGGVAVAVMVVETGVAMKITRLTMRNGRKSSIGLRVHAMLCHA